MPPSSAPAAPSAESLSKVYLPDGAFSRAPSLACLLCHDNPLTCHASSAWHFFDRCIGSVSRNRPPARCMRSAPKPGASASRPTTLCSQNHSAEISSILLVPTLGACKGKERVVQNFAMPMENCRGLVAEQYLCDAKFDLPGDIRFPDRDEHSAAAGGRHLPICKLKGQVASLIPICHHVFLVCLQIWT